MYHPPNQANQANHSGNLQVQDALHGEGGKMESYQRNGEQNKVKSCSRKYMI